MSPPGLARHERARPRRDLDVLVLLPRARDDPRPVRDVVGPAHAHALLPGRRRDRGHPARLRARRCASSSSRCPTRVDQYADLLDKNEIVLAAPARRRRRRRARRCSALGVTGPLLRAAGNPWDLRKAAPYSSYDHFDFKIPVGTRRRQLRPLPRAPRRDVRVGARSSSRRSTACPRARTSPTTARSRCRRATSWRPDGGADPPLQARHRGLPRAAGRGLLPDRVARAASSAASCAPTARASPRACTCATRQLRQPAGAARRWSRTPTSPT